MRHTWRGVVLNIQHCFIYYVFAYTNFKFSLFSFFFYRLSILKILLRILYNTSSALGKNNKEEFSYLFCRVRVIAGV